MDKLTLIGPSRVADHTFTDDKGQRWALYVVHTDEDQLCRHCQWKAAGLVYGRVRTTSIHDELIIDKPVTYEGKFCSLCCWAQYHMPGEHYS